MPANLRPRLRAALAGLLTMLLALVLAACGPDDQPTGEDVPLPSVTNPATKTPGKAGAAGADDGTDRADKGGKGKDEDGDEGDGDGDGGGSGGGGGNGGGGGGSGGGGGNDGGGTDGGSGGAAPSGPPIPNTKTTLTLAVGGATPGFDPPTLSARAGTVTLLLRNGTSEEHAIAVKGTEFAEKKSSTVGPGETAKLVVRLPVGEYDVYCTEGEHRFANFDNPESAVLSVR